MSKPSVSAEPGPALRRRWSVFVWALVGAVGSAIVIGVGVFALGPKVVYREVKVHELRYEQRKELRQVQTPNGKPIQALVPVPVTRSVEVSRTQEVTRKPTPEQRLRLWFLLGAGGLVGLFTLGVMVAWFTFFFRKDREPPKQLEDWLKYLVSGLLGAVLGFLGAPLGESQVKTRLLDPSETNSTPAQGDRPAPPTDS